MNYTFGSCVSASRPATISGDIRSRLASGYVEPVGAPGDEWDAYLDRL